MYQRFHRVFVFVFSFVCVFSIAVPAYALVNINTADSETLQTLTGIGPTYAGRIIDYREGANGPFETIEEIMQVSGIGQATFDKIKNDITVGDVTPAPQQQTTTTQETTTTETETTPKNTGSGGSGVWYDDTKFISVDAGQNRTVFVGADSVFEARVTGATGDIVPNARVVWSFGNGDRKEGANVLYNFAFPGEYVVVADASNDVYSASDRVVVTAVPALLSLTEVTPDYIAIKNNTNVEVDIGGWLLFSAGRQFQFPQHTVVLSGQEVLVSNKRTGLSGADPSTVVLQYPNGLVATAYQYPLFLERGGGSPAPASADAGVGAAPAQTAALAVPDEAPLASRNNLITSPGAAQEGDGGLWPWLAAVGMIAGLGGAGAVYVRRRRESEYDVQEIS